MKAILLVSHGSRSSKTKKEIEALVKRIKARSALKIIRYAFLEIESPSIPEGISRCVDEGASDILLLMNFLNAGRHMDADIPAIVKEERQKYPKVKISMSKPVGQHEKIVDLFLDMAKP
jgi:sirohydrochlorin ferrochelatase